MASIANKSSSINILLCLSLLSIVVLPYIEACGTCGPTPKPVPSPPPPAATTPCPPPPPPSHLQYYCPRDTLKLGVCAILLGPASSHFVIGKPPSGSKCCALLTGLTDLEAAACLCTAIKANVLGTKLDVPVALTVLLTDCQKNLPPGFTCK